MQEYVPRAASPICWTAIIIVHYVNCRVEQNQSRKCSKFTIILSQTAGSENLLRQTLLELRVNAFVPAAAAEEAAGASRCLNPICPDAKQSRVGCDINYFPLGAYVLRCWLW